MINHSAVALSTAHETPRELSVDAADRKILRNLAARTAELAARPAEREKQDLWRKHNDLEETRPLIFCDPENGWNEIIPEKQLKCRGSLARIWEMTLRKEIFWGESMGDDRVVEPFFNVPFIAVESDWGMHETRIGGDAGGSYVWEAPLKDYADMEKLRVPKISVDRRRTQELFDLACAVLGDNLSVRIKGVWWWSLGLTWTLVNLRGLEQILFDLYDYPDELHRLMGFLRDGTLKKLDFLEENGLLSLNNDGSYVGSGGFGWTSALPREDFKGNVRTLDMWGFCESQETCSISPEMFAEFVFPYQLPILERFGLNCYGCCEALNARWDVIRAAPRLRRVSVSPWANLPDMAERLQNRYVLSLKPNPAYLAVPQTDEAMIRKTLRDAVRAARGCRLEIIMKDNHTLGGNPRNAVRWCEIAREEAER